MLLGAAWLRRCAGRRSEAATGTAAEAALHVAARRPRARHRRAARRPDRRRRTPSCAPRLRALADARRGARRGHGLPLPLRPRSASCSRSATGSPTPRGPGGSTPRATTCSPPRRASPASSPSRKGEVPQEHWFQLGRPLTSVDGAPALLSWSATMFEYLMPLLLMRSYPGHAARPRLPRSRCARQMQYARSARRALGHLRVGLRGRRPLGPLPVQGLRRAGPGLEARARRTSWWSRPTRPRSPRSSTPSRGRGNLQRLAELGLEGPLGFYEALDYTPRKGDVAARRHGRGRPGCVVRAYLAHHQGMTLVRARATCCATPPMVRRFHADPRVQATELLLQERVPRPRR